MNFGGTHQTRTRIGLSGTMDRLVQPVTIWPTWLPLFCTRRKGPNTRRNDLQFPAAKDP